MTAIQKMKRWWTYFRRGHGIYLSFILSFGQFGLIVYALLIERIPFLLNIFPRMAYFLIVFFMTYIPLSVIVGKWDYDKVFPTEQVMGTMTNPAALDQLKVLSLLCELLPEDKRDEAKKILSKWVKEE